MKHLTILFIDVIWNGIVDFFLEYFVNEDSYNVFNTAVYVSLGLVACYLVFIFLEKMNQKMIDKYGDRYTPVKPTKEFFLSIIPYIFLGSTLRALKDTHFIPDSFRLFETPLIYVFMIVFTIIVGVFIVWICTVKLGDDWKPIFFGVGAFTEIMFLLPMLTLIDSDGFIGGIGVVTATIILVSIFLVLGQLNNVGNLKQKESRILKGLNKSFSIENIIVLGAQMFDASATVISITFFEYGEKHVIPDFLFSELGTWTFWIFKFVIVFTTLILMDNFLDESDREREVRSWLKWVILLLGLATGSRDTLRLITNT